jgi:hypothetical protein
MRLPKRFTLSSLLLVMLLVSLVFGYAQWRRQWFLSEVDALNKDYGTSLLATDGLFWPTVAQRNITLKFTKSVHGNYVRDGKIYDYEQLMSYLEPLVVKYRAVGVKSITLSVEHFNGAPIYSENLSLDVGAE